MDNYRKLVTPSTVILDSIRNSSSLFIPLTIDLYIQLHSISIQLKDDSRKEFASLSQQAWIRHCNSLGGKKKRKKRHSPCIKKPYTYSNMFLGNKTLLGFCFCCLTDKHQALIACFWIFFIPWLPHIQQQFVVLQWDTSASYGKLCNWHRESNL